MLPIQMNRYFFSFSVYHFCTWSFSARCFLLYVSLTFFQIGGEALIRARALRIRTEEQGRADDDRLCRQVREREREVRESSELWFLRL